jgi:hypothetical protein
MMDAKINITNQRNPPSPPLRRYAEKKEDKRTKTTILRT